MKKRGMIVCDLITSANFLHRKVSADDGIPDLILKDWLLKS